jgi:hypothetical protein
LQREIEDELQELSGRERAHGNWETEYHKIK